MRPMYSSMTSLILALTALFVTSLPLSCGEKGTSGSDSDTDADTDSDTDVDTDADSDTDGDCGAAVDCSACEGPICIGAVSGRVEDQDGTPLPGQIQICVPNCMTTPIDDNGDFCKEFESCRRFDFDGDAELGVSEELHPTVYENELTHTRYTVAYEPTQEEVSDQGADDFVYDFGTLKQFALPGDSTEYTDSGGATVTDLDGVSFELDPGDITCKDDADTCAVHAYEFPLQEWTPPFVHDDPPLDALYYLDPYLHEVTDGVVLHIDPTAAGWTDGDSGTVWVLGDFANVYFTNCGGDDLPLGHMEPCASASYQGGEIVTDPMPFLGWIGLVKD